MRPNTPRLNFEVQYLLGLKDDLAPPLHTGWPLSNHSFPASRPRLS
jgi:hypothetical protein